MTTQTLDQEQAVSVDAERRALGACLMATPSYDPVADVARAVREGDWYEPGHELVWSAVVRLHGASRPTGVPAVEAELRRTGELERAGGVVGLSQLASAACSSAEAGHYAGLVHGYAQVRRYQQALVRGMQAARQADPLTVPETIAAHQAELEYLAADEQADDDTFGRFGDHLDAHLDSLAISLPPAAITGFTDLDSLMKLMPGQMILVAARPAMGKSAFALGVATANARNGAPTLVHSLEMGRAEVSNRILSARARVAFHHIRDGVDGLTQDDWDRIDRHTLELRGLPLWMDCRVLLQALAPGGVHGLEHLVSDVTGSEFAHCPTLDDHPRRWLYREVTSWTPSAMSWSASERTGSGRRPARPSPRSSTTPGRSSRCRATTPARS